MSISNVATIKPLQGPLSGSVGVPGDKSISHRAILFSAMAEGTSQLSGILDSADVRSSIKAVSALGAQVNLEQQEDGSLVGSITGWGKAGPKQPDEPLDCGNSGTTARLLMGVLAPWGIEVTVTGDESLQKRPMRRITAPLMKMGVRFAPEGRETLPLTMQGTSHLKAIHYDAPMASAQLKTAVLVAGVYADGTTVLHEPAPSRNHTELMLPEYGIETMASDLSASVKGPKVLKACDIEVPGDPSSAAFLACAAVLTPGSSVLIDHVSLNTARIGFVRTLERMDADIVVRRKGSAGKEPYGEIEVNYTAGLHGCEIPADKIATVIDEIPVLSLVAAFTRGVTVFRGVEELRVKEADRLQGILDGLDLMGVDAWIDSNDLYIEGQPGLKLDAELKFDSCSDHRLAMTWSLAGLVGGSQVEVTNFDSIKVSYPHFLSDIERLAQ